MTVSATRIGGPPRSDGRPAVTRALLLTDVVDSTRISAAIGDAASAALWQAHDRAARDLLVAHGGVEIDKTDGFLLLFERPSSALAFAADYQRALSTLDPPLRARAGLHVGEVLLRENAPADVARGAKPLEVEGLAKPVVARVMGVALGGQTLLSPPAREALGEQESVSHGHWRMKGVPEPVELFEVVAPGAPLVPPPDGDKAYRVVAKDGLWLPVREVRRNLPAERDAFVGRDADLRALSAALETSRLVSVLGPGGAGKTRLVTRHAWSWLGEYPGGAWFCDLSEARSADGICQAVARGLDVPLLGVSEPAAWLGRCIADRGACLIVLDNFEQVSRWAADTVGSWLDAAADARFVVTTREVLGIPGETALALAPLGGSDAEALFLARAQQASRDFAPSADDLRAVHHLVGLLDGLPLAIELAAARARVMSPTVLVERMSARFKLLTSSRGRSSRQATLRGAIDWSWDLLAEEERDGLARLSVFEGGFSLGAAEALLDTEHTWGADVVQALVDRSLVRRVGDDRYDLLVSLQEYAAERLAERGGTEETQRLHVAFFAAKGSEQEADRWFVHGGVARRAALVPDADNLAAAARRAIRLGDAAAAAGAAIAAWAVFEKVGPYRAGIALLEAVAAMPGGTPSVRLLVTLGVALGRAGRAPQAAPYLERALELARAAGDRRREAIALSHKAQVLRGTRDPETRRAWFGEALAIHRSVGDRVSEAVTLGNLGLLLQEQGRFDEARATQEAALAVNREVGNRVLEGVCLSNLGIVHAALGRRDAARACYEAALAIAREHGDRPQQAVVLGNLGNLLRSAGDTEHVAAHYEAALSLAREVGQRSFEGVVLGNLGLLHLDANRIEDARACFRDAGALAREAGNLRSEGRVLEKLASLELVVGDHDAARAAGEAALSALRAVGDRAGEAQCLVHVAAAAVRAGDADGALARLDTAIAIARDLGMRSLEGAAIGTRAGARRAAGRAGEALSDLHEALAIHEEVGDTALAAEALLELAALDADDGQLESARARLAESERLARAVGAPAPLVRLLCERTRLEVGETARATLAEAVALAAEARVSERYGVAHALRRAMEGIDPR